MEQQLSTGDQQGQPQAVRYGWLFSSSSSSSSNNGKNSPPESIYSLPSEDESEQVQEPTTDLAKSNAPITTEQIMADSYNVTSQSLDDDQFLPISITPESPIFYDEEVKEEVKDKFPTSPPHIPAKTTNKAAARRRWSDFAGLLTEKGRVPASKDTTKKATNNNDISSSEAVDRRLTAFLRERRKADQLLNEMPGGSRTSFSRELRRKRYSNAMIDSKAAAAAFMVVRPFSATAEHRKFSLPESRGFAQLSLRNMREYWAAELPQEDEEAKEEARYMEYYLDETREGLNISDILHDVTPEAVQYGHGGSELKADKKNRVEEMKLGKLVQTLNSQKRSMEVLLKKEEQMIKWRTDRQSGMASRGSNMAVNELRLSEAKHKEFEERRKLYDNAISMLKTSGDKTLAQIYRQRLLNHRIKQLRYGGLSNVQAVVLAQRHAQKSAERRDLLKPGDFGTPIPARQRPQSAVVQKAASSAIYYLTANKQAKDDAIVKESELTAASSSDENNNNTNSNEINKEAEKAAPDNQTQVIDKVNKGEKKQPHIKSCDRLLHQKKGMSKLERQLQALDLIS